MDTVIHEHCDRHMISQYIKRYNNHTSMNANQKAFTYLDNFAGCIREISNSRFFLDYSVFSESEITKGIVERVIVETVMCSNYFSDWKKQTKAACRYLNNHASQGDFERLIKNVHRLEGIITDDIKDMFNSKDSFIFITLFDRFTKFGLADKRFADFLVEFKNNIRHSRKNREGMLFDEIDKDRSTKDKVVIAAKLDLLEGLMKEFLHIHDTNVDDEELFISQNVGIDPKAVSEDFVFYNETLDELATRTIRDGSKLLEETNRPSLLAMVAYSYKEDEDLDDWLSDYAENNNMYLVDQEKNFLQMKHEFEVYCKENREG